MTTFFAMNLEATFGGWVLYRDGEVFARTFATEREAKRYAKEFCERNGVPFCWTR